MPKLRPVYKRATAERDLRINYHMATHIYAAHQGPYLMRTQN